MIQLPVLHHNYTIDINPSKIIALGLNYHSHLEESNKVSVSGFTGEIPKEPVLFPKLPSALTISGAPIIIPEIVKSYNFKNERTDYEGELAFIISKECRSIKPENAFNYILGYTIMNDVSQRNIQNEDKSGWFRGKSFDTFAPIGPVVVLQEDIGDPNNLSIATRLNGKTVQDSNTRFMIFNINQMLSFISKNFTLYPGDIISTGTPAGVGPVQEGDIVEIEIEKIGILKNNVQVEK